MTQLDLRKIALGQKYKKWRFTVTNNEASEIIELLDTEKPSPMQVKDAYCEKHSNFDQYDRLRVRRVKEDSS